ncbi:glutathione S-transferase N-terminal domain-containing protein [Luteimonas sp. MC1750]|uniref:glutathione S-transferase N-terminal domain-containing protein n=1 Tax=Luteimonas sp. MC1750 TaxID=2799326 RepID=UPI0018F088E3|nr:glutathione S-transferase N-terminal domain-containing protein [Luteimonas sp. MC1750]MBJ6985085.1 glutathione S-transferase N-terminal domain-containing protein [Luteimonas sp. MC1750]QQO05745.1 glutathione S-transferase N-terminal domain-containing protein [Luteimonas sp. MC1750]
MIDLHYWPTPNGHKVTLLLEEAGLDYRIHPVDIGQGDQFAPAFLAISPNNKMPAIVDHAPSDGGAPQAVFESGAILLYLAEKTGRFLPADPRARIEVLEWLFWQMAGLGPMTGQYGHFSVYAPEPVPYAIDRYTKEALRLLGVLERRLAGRAFIAGDYSIADMAAYPWINVYDRAPLDLAPFPEVRRWQAAIAARPATQRAYALSKQVNPAAGAPMSDAEKAVLFGQGAKRD